MLYIILTDYTLLLWSNVNVKVLDKQINTKWIIGFVYHNGRPDLFNLILTYISRTFHSNITVYLYGRFYMIVEILKHIDKTVIYT